MCGILAILDIASNTPQLRKLALDLVKKIRHRGPDWSGVFSSPHAILAHERLAIVDVMSGSQPLIDATNGNALAVNGEIYNHKDLRHQLKHEHAFQTESDCEVILYLYKEKGADFLKDLSGIFAFVLYDSIKKTYLISRDHLGIVPLYMGWDDEGRLYVASELKAIVDHFNKTLSEGLTALQIQNQGCHVDFYNTNEIFTQVFKNAEKCLSKEGTEKGKGKKFAAHLIFTLRTLPPVQYEMPKQVAVVPKQPESKEQLIAKLEEIKQTASIYIKRIPESDPELKIKHPFLGWLNTAEWIELCNIHFRHHMRQKKRIEKHFGWK